MNLRRIVRTLFHDNKKVLQLKTRMNITIIAQLKQSKANFHSIYTQTLLFLYEI